MKYKTAMAEVFAKYRNPRTRTCAVALLERYASKTRPITAWHAVGEDADASRMLLESLGFREPEHFTVQTSVLDPGAHRFNWSVEGERLLMSFTDELANMNLTLVQRLVLTRGVDPVQHLSDVEPQKKESVDASDPSLIPMVVSRTQDIVSRIMSQPYGSDAASSLILAREWAETWLDNPDLCTPVAPLYILEILAGLDGVEGLPPFRVFNKPAVPDTRAQASRPLRDGETVTPAGRLNALPLTEQVDSPALRGYLATTLEDFLRFPPTQYAAVWTQFDADVKQTDDSFNFALDAEAMRMYVEKLVENGYSGLKCALVDTTRLGVGNLALGGSVPGNEDLDDDDGDESQFKIRVEESPYPASAVVYSGAYVLTDRDLAERHSWTGTATHPVRIVEDGDDADKAVNAEVENKGLTVDEMAQEWFMVTHGCKLDGSLASSQESSGSSVSGTHEARYRNLKTFRNEIAGLTKADMLNACSPLNPAFLKDGSGKYTSEGAFVNGVCVAMRRFGGGPDNRLAFIKDSPYFPTKAVAGVWSGYTTDFSPVSRSAAERDDVFPLLTSNLVFRSLHEVHPDVAQQATDFCCLMRERPELQMKFAKRSAGTHRSHTVVIETNVDARAFIDNIVHSNNAQAFTTAVWRAFFSSFGLREADPLVAIDDVSARWRTVSNNRFMDGLRLWARTTCPDLARYTDTSPYSPLSGSTALHIGWTADTLGRLILVVSTQRADLANTVKLSFRYAKDLPLPSAAYLKEHGGMNICVFERDGDPFRRFLALLRVAMKQPAFAWANDFTTGMCGRFGTQYLKGPLWDFYSDEYMSRAWYIPALRNVVVPVSSLVGPA